MRKLSREPERVSLTCEAGRALLRHRWPMNVRELEKCLESALVLAGGSDRLQPIDLQHLPPAIRRSGSTQADPPELRALHTPAAVAPLRPLAPEDAKRRDELIVLLEEHHGNVAAVARVLGKARMQVHRWLKRYDLHLEKFR